MIKLLFLCYVLSEVVSKPQILKDDLTNKWEKSGKFEGDIHKHKTIVPRNMVINQRWLWPGGIVPYDVNATAFDFNAWKVINESMRTLENAIAERGIRDGSCQLQFVPREPHHRGYIHIMDDGPGKCWSAVGYAGVAQNLSLGKDCVDVGTIMHELMHALGFQHQHQAHDRDKYIKIMKENVNETYAFALEKAPNDDMFTSYGLDYDFKSIMHYSAFAFAKIGKDGQYVGPTIVPKDPNVQIETNNELSEMDKIKLQILYCRNHTKIP